MVIVEFMENNGFNIFIPFVKYIINISSVKFRFKFCYCFIFYLTGINVGTSNRQRFPTVEQSIIYLRKLLANIHLHSIGSLSSSLTKISSPQIGLICLSNRICSVIQKRISKTSMFLNKDSKSNKTCFSSSSNGDKFV